ncbi:MAG: HupE/UreJ family protein, partial [Myxococcales bacterium]
MRRALPALLFALLLFLARGASAHKPSDSYLVLQRTTSGATGRWDIALRDLEPAVGLDQDHDGTVNWGELKSRLPIVRAYAAARLHATTASGGCRVSLTEQGVIAHSDGKYVALGLDLSCPADAGSIVLRYDLLFDIDAQHRSVLRYSDGDVTQALVFSKTRRELTLSHVAPRFWAIVRLGIEHILSGYDHLLFLTALLLPSVLRRREGKWLPARDFRSV